MPPDPPPAAEPPGESVDLTLEAVELSRLRRLYSHTELAASTHHSNHHQNIQQNKGFLTTAIRSVRKFWSHQISVTVPHDACRDHLALERTFLTYLHTSISLSTLGVVVAQLFRIQHHPTPNPQFGFFVLGKPLACICHGAAIFCLCLGAYRSWRLQNAIVRSKAITGGFELLLLGLGVLMLIVTIFALVVAVDIEKEY